mgnify:CR=1 FL=1
MKKIYRFLNMKWHIVIIFILGSYLSINIGSFVFILLIAIFTRSICKGAIWIFEILEEVGYELKRIFYPTIEENIGITEEVNIYETYDFEIFINQDLELLPVVNLIDLEE